jgi:hypothetical protein
MRKEAWTGFAVPAVREDPLAVAGGHAEGVSGGVIGVGPPIADGFRRTVAGADVAQRGLDIRVADPGQRLAGRATEGDAGSGPIVRGLAAISRYRRAHD